MCMRYMVGVHTSRFPPRRRSGTLRSVCLSCGLPGIEGVQKSSQTLPFHVSYDIMKKILHER